MLKMRLELLGDFEVLADRQPVKTVHRNEVGLELASLVLGDPEAD